VDEVVDVVMRRWKKMRWWIHTSLYEDHEE
jgi:hypothetical protein